MDPSFLHADSEDSDQPAQADLSLHWAHTHFVGFVISRLNGSSSENKIQSSKVFSFIHRNPCPNSLSFSFQKDSYFLHKRSPNKGTLVSKSYIFAAVKMIQNKRCLRERFFFFQKYQIP